MDLSAVCDDSGDCIIVITKAAGEAHECLIPLTNHGSTDRDKEDLPDVNHVAAIRETNPDGVDVVYSEDVALETVVTTTSTTAQEGLEEEDTRVPVTGQIVEVQEGDSSSRNDLSSLNTLTSKSGCYEDELLDLSTQLTAKEISKRNKDRLYKQQQRKNPEYKAKERVKSRQRMKDKRKDPMYREMEREKDRVRRRQVREENTELREREKERDREYRKKLKTGEKVKISFVKSISLRNNSYEDNMSDSGSDNCVSVENCYTCQDTVSNFLGSRGNMDLHVTGDHILSLHGGVSDSDSYSSSDKNEQFEITFNT